MFGTPYRYRILEKNLENRIRKIDSIKFIILNKYKYEDYTNKVMYLSSMAHYFKCVYIRRNG